MGMTTPTRKPYHTGTDALWASSAAAGDVESTPSDAEKIAGHVQNTGLTSGRANWLTATVGEWFKRIRDGLFLQHTDTGGHYEISATGAATVAKITTTADAGDSSSTAQVQVKNSGGTTVWKVANDGVIIANGHAVILPSDLTPLDFSDTAVGGDNDGTFQRDATSNYARFNVDDANTRALISRTFQIPRGVTVHYLKVYFNRPTNAGQTITVTLYNKNWDSAAGVATAGSVTDATVTTGNQTISSGDLVVPAITEYGFFIKIDIDNSTPGAGNALQFKGALITWSV